MEKMSMIYETLLSLHAELVLDDAIREFKKKRLYEEIDLALQQGDESNFLKLTEELIRIQDEWNNRRTAS